MASPGLARSLLDTLTCSLKALGDRRASEVAAEAAGVTPGPGAAPGCGELLRTAERHVFLKGKWHFAAMLSIPDRTRRHRCRGCSLVSSCHGLRGSIYLTQMRTAQ